MSLWVKLCGLRTPEDVEAAVAAGADAVGFVMTASFRQVGLDEAARLVAAVPDGLISVGVFYRPDRAVVERVRNRVPFDLFQAEPESLRGIEGIETLPVVHDQPELDAAVDRAFETATTGRALVESAGRGGTGRSPDWGRVAGLTRLSELVIAGGFDVGNVAAAVASLQPGGVDVSSGVESSPGVKDHGMMRDFVAMARRAAREVV